jgi:hypothetical protein
MSFPFNYPRSFLQSSPFFLLVWLLWSQIFQSSQENHSILDLQFLTSYRNSSTRTEVQKRKIVKYAIFASATASKRNVGEV